VIVGYWGWGVLVWCVLGWFDPGGGGLFGGGFVGGCFCVFLWFLCVLSLSWGVEGVRAFVGRWCVGVIVVGVGVRGWFFRECFLECWGCGCVAGGLCGWGGGGCLWFVVWGKGENRYRDREIYG